MQPTIVGSRRLAAERIKDGKKELSVVESIVLKGEGRNILALEGYNNRWVKDGTF